MKAKREAKPGSDDYLRLIQQFPLKAIRTTAESEKAAAFIEPLATKGEDALTPGAAAYLDVMVELIGAFEDRQTPAPRGTPVEIVKHLLEANAMTASDLGRLLGSRGLGTLILNSKRELSKAHIRTLSQRFNVPASLLL